MNTRFLYNIADCIFQVNCVGRFIILVKIIPNLDTIGLAD
jgi:hypothetical protein